MYTWSEFNIIIIILFLGLLVIIVSFNKHLLRIEIYQTLGTVFSQISKHLEFRQKILCYMSYVQQCLQCLEIR